MDDLRAVAAKITADNSQYFLDRAEFLELCVENGEVATDVMRMMLVSKYGEVKVDWKVRVKCKVDNFHGLVYIPQLPGFGVGNAGSNISGTRAMQGIGSTNGGKYRCTVCGHIVV